MYGMTEKQRAFIQRLAEQKRLDPDVRIRLEYRMANNDIDVVTASRTIEWMLKQEDKAPSTIREAVQPGFKQQMAEVHEGRYAVEQGGTLKFVIVDKPTEGKWAGRTFVSVQASDDKYPVRDWTKRNELLALIAVDPQTAMLRYGKELGSCGHCGRTLTNEESRQYGIGPICRGKMGW